MKQAIVPAAKGCGEVNRNSLERMNRRFLQLAMRRIGDREDAADVVQETFLTIYRHSAQTRFTVGFEAWSQGVLRIMIKKYYHNRQKRPHQVPLINNKSDSLLPVIVPSGIRYAISLKAAYRKMIYDHNRYARLLNLHYQGFSTREICHRLVMSTSNYYVSLGRARQLFRSIIMTGARYARPPGKAHQDQ